MRSVRPSQLKWSTLLLLGIVVLASFSLRTISEPPIWREKTKIGFIGDSITHSLSRQTGAVEAEQALLKDILAINRGKSGSTTADWLPGRPLFDDTLAVFKAQNVHTVSIMLGTNDARADKAISPAIYRNNMERIIKALLDSGVVRLVIINYPPYVVPGSHQAWNDASVTRLKLYSKQLDVVVRERGVAQGDIDAFSYFKAHPYQLVDGVHPTIRGNEKLGELWAKAYERIMDREATRHRDGLLIGFASVLVTSP